MENENKLDEALLFFLNESLERIILSNPRQRNLPKSRPFIRIWAQKRRPDM